MRGGSVYAEQALRLCARCRAALAVQYEFTADRVPELRSADGVRAVECPRCHHLNLLVLPRHAQHMVVKAIHAA
ncbi:MAG TPA: hypothetical protein VKA01_08635 [Vicinamibacteria bacterium]|nr:hypothetical protein [Vicinamibacteria bacterium]